MRLTLPITARILLLVVKANLYNQLHLQLFIKCPDCIRANPFSRNAMNSLKKISLALCLLCLALNSSVSAQVDPVVHLGTLAFRAGSSWGASQRSQAQAEASAMAAATLHYDRALIELELMGYTIIDSEAPNITNSRWYGGKYGWGAHASWSVLGEKTGPPLETFSFEDIQPFWE